MHCRNKCIQKLFRYFIINTHKQTQWAVKIDSRMIGYLPHKGTILSLRLL